MPNTHAVCAVRLIALDGKSMWTPGRPTRAGLLRAVATNPEAHTPIGNMARATGPLTLQHTKRGPRRRGLAGFGVEELMACTEPFIAE